MHSKEDRKTVNDACAAILILGFLHSGACTAYPFLCITASHPVPSGILSGMMLMSQNSTGILRPLLQVEGVTLQYDTGQRWRLET